MGLIQGDEGEDAVERDDELGLWLEDGNEDGPELDDAPVLPDKALLLGIALALELELAPSCLGIATRGILSAKSGRLAQ